MLADTRKRRLCLAIGLLFAALGIVSLGASRPLLMLQHGGWPWNATVTSDPATQTASAELVHDNGTVETFSGSRGEVDAWLADREAALKKSYGLDTKIAAGHALTNIGFALVVLATAALCWPLLARLRRQAETRHR